MSSPIPNGTMLAHARDFVSRYHPRTLLQAYEGLSLPGRTVFAKHEHHTPVGSFKGRGALYALSCLSTEERKRGVITASTGNHGQGIAWAGTILGIGTTVVVPADTPRVKTRAIQRHGATLLEVDGNLLDATEHARQAARHDGYVFVEDGDHAGLMAGAASIAWEVFEQLPSTAVFVVPVGGGNLIAGVAMVARLLNSGVRIIGVQSEAAPAVHDSFLAGEPTRAGCNTIAGGLATSVPGTLAFSVILDRVDEICLVSEAELLAGVPSALEATGQLVEPSAAAPVSALNRYGASWPAGDTVLILSGGNIEPSEVQRALATKTVTGPRQAEHSEGQETGFQRSRSGDGSV